MIKQTTLQNILTCVIAVIIFIFQSLNYLIAWIKQYAKHKEISTTDVTANTTISNSKPNNNNTSGSFIRAQELIQKHFDIPLIVAEDDPKVDNLIKNTELLDSNTFSKDEYDQFMDHLIDDSYVARGLGLITATIGREAEFYLYSKYDNDFEGIIIELKGRNSEIGEITILNRKSVSPIEPKSIPIEYIYDEDRIKVAYTLFTEGVHTLTLSRNNIPICRSPYYISVEKSPTNSRSRIRLGTKKYRMVTKFGKVKHTPIETKDNIVPITESSKSTVESNVQPMAEETPIKTDVMSIITKFESKNKGIKTKVPKRMTSITEKSLENDAIHETLTYSDKQQKIEISHKKLNTYDNVLNLCKINSGFKITNKKCSHNIDINNENYKQIDTKNTIDTNYEEENKFITKHDKDVEITNDVLKKVNLSSSHQKAIDSVDVLLDKINYRKSSKEEKQNETSSTNELLEKQNNGVVSTNLVEIQSKIKSASDEENTKSDVSYFDDDNKESIDLIKNTNELESNTNDHIVQQITDTTQYNINTPSANIITKITNSLCDKCSKQVIEILSELPRDINIKHNENSNESHSNFETFLAQPIRININIDNVFDNAISKNINEHSSHLQINNSKKIEPMDTNDNIKCLSLCEKDLLENNFKKLVTNNMNAELLIEQKVHNDEVNNKLGENISDKIKISLTEHNIEIDKEVDKENILTENILRKCSANEEEESKNSIIINTNTIHKQDNELELQIQNTQKSIEQNIDFIQSSDYNISENVNNFNEKCTVTSETNDLSTINDGENTNDKLGGEESKRIIKQEANLEENSNFQSSTINDTTLVPIKLISTNEEGTQLDNQQKTNSICETNDRSLEIVTSRDKEYKLMIEKCIESMLNSFKSEMVERILQLCLNKDISNDNNTKIVKDPVNELNEIKNINHIKNTELNVENKEMKNNDNKIQITQEKINKEISEKILCEEKTNDNNLLKHIEKIIKKNINPNSTTTSAETKLQQIVNAAMQNPNTPQNNTTDFDKINEEIISASANSPKMSRFNFINTVIEDDIKHVKHNNDQEGKGMEDLLYEKLDILSVNNVSKSQISYKTEIVTLNSLITENIENKHETPLVVIETTTEENTNTTFEPETTSTPQLLNETETITIEECNVVKAESDVQISECIENLTKLTPTRISKISKTNNSEENTLKELIPEKIDDTVENLTSNNVFNLIENLNKSADNITCNAQPPESTRNIIKNNLNILQIETFNEIVDDANNLGSLNMKEYVNTIEILNTEEDKNINKTKQLNVDFASNFTDSTGEEIPSTVDTKNTILNVTTPKEEKLNETELKTHSDKYKPCEEENVTANKSEIPENTRKLYTKSQIQKLSDAKTKNENDIHITEVDKISINTPNRKNYIEDEQNKIEILNIRYDSISNDITTSIQPKLDIEQSKSTKEVPELNCINITVVAKSRTIDIQITMKPEIENENNSEKMKNEEHKHIDEDTKSGTSTLLAAEDESEEKENNFEMNTYSNIVNQNSVTKVESKLKTTETVEPIILKEIIQNETENQPEKKTLDLNNELVNNETNDDTKMVTGIPISKDGQTITTVKPEESKTATVSKISNSEKLPVLSIENKKIVEENTTLVSMQSKNVQVSMVEEIIKIQTENKPENNQNNYGVVATDTLKTTNAEINTIITALKVDETLSTEETIKPTRTLAQDISQNEIKEEPNIKTLDPETVIIATSKQIGTETVIDNQEPQVKQIVSFQETLKPEKQASGAFTVLSEFEILPVGQSMKIEIEPLSMDLSSKESPDLIIENIKKEEEIISLSNTIPDKESISKEVTIEKATESPTENELVEVKTVVIDNPNSVDIELKENILCEETVIEDTVEPEIQTSDPISVCNSPNIALVDKNEKKETELVSVTFNSKELTSMSIENKKQAKVYFVSQETIVTNTPKQINTEILTEYQELQYEQTFPILKSVKREEQALEVDDNISSDTILTEHIKCSFVEGIIHKEIETVNSTSEGQNKTIIEDSIPMVSLVTETSIPVPDTANVALLENPLISKAESVSLILDGPVEKSIVVEEKNQLVLREFEDVQPISIEEKNQIKIISLDSESLKDDSIKYIDIETSVNITETQDNEIIMEKSIELTSLAEEKNLNESTKHSEINLVDPQTVVIEASEQIDIQTVIENQVSQYEQTMSINESVKLASRTLFDSSESEIILEQETLKTENVPMPINLNSIEPSAVIIEDKIEVEINVPSACITTYDEETLSVEKTIQRSTLLKIKSEKIDSETFVEGPLTNMLDPTSATLDLMNLPRIDIENKTEIDVEIQTDSTITENIQSLEVENTLNLETVTNNCKSKDNKTLPEDSILPEKSITNIIPVSTIIDTTLVEVPLKIDTEHISLPLNLNELTVIEKTIKEEEEVILLTSTISEGSLDTSTEETIQNEKYKVIQKTDALNIPINTNSEILETNIKIPPNEENVSIEETMKLEKPTLMSISNYISSERVPVEKHLEKEIEFISTTLNFKYLPTELEEITKQEDVKIQLTPTVSEDMKNISTKETMKLQTEIFIENELSKHKTNLEVTTENIDTKQEINLQKLQQEKTILTEKTMKSEKLASDLITICNSDTTLVDENLQTEIELESVTFVSKKSTTSLLDNTKKTKKQTESDSKRTIDELTLLVETTIQNTSIHRSESTHIDPPPLIEEVSKTDIKPTLIMTLNTAEYSAVNFEGKIETDRDILSDITFENTKTLLIKETILTEIETDSLKTENDTFITVDSIQPAKQITDINIMPISSASDIAPVAEPFSTKANHVSLTLNIKENFPVPKVVEDVQAVSIQEINQNETHMENKSVDMKILEKKSSKSIDSDIPINVTDTQDYKITTTEKYVKPITALIEETNQNKSKIHSEIKLEVDPETIVIETSKQVDSQTITLDQLSQDKQILEVEDPVKKASNTLFDSSESEINLEQKSLKKENDPISMNLNSIESSDIPIESKKKVEVNIPSARIITNDEQTLTVEKTLQNETTIKSEKENINPETLVEGQLKNGIDPVASKLIESSDVPTEKKLQVEVNASSSSFIKTNNAQSLSAEDTIQYETKYQQENKTIDSESIIINTSMIIHTKVVADIPKKEDVITLSTEECIKPEKQISDMIPILSDPEMDLERKPLNTTIDPISSTAQEEIIKKEREEILLTSAISKNTGSDSIEKAIQNKTENPKKNELENVVIVTLKNTDTELESHVQKLQHNETVKTKELKELENQASKSCSIPSETEITLTQQHLKKETELVCVIFNPGDSLSVSDEITTLEEENISLVTTTSEDTQNVLIDETIKKESECLTKNELVEIKSTPINTSKNIDIEIGTCFQKSTQKESVPSENPETSESPISDAPDLIPEKNLLKTEKESVTLNSFTKEFPNILDIGKTELNVEPLSTETPPNKDTFLNKEPIQIETKQTPENEVQDYETFVTDTLKITCPEIDLDISKSQAVQISCTRIPSEQEKQSVDDHLIFNESDLTPVEEQLKTNTECTSMIERSSSVLLHNTKEVIEEISPICIESEDEVGIYTKEIHQREIKEFTENEKVEPKDAVIDTFKTIDSQNEKMVQKLNVNEIIVTEEISDTISIFNSTDIVPVEDILKTETEALPLYSVESSSTSIINTKKEGTEITSIVTKNERKLSVEKMIQNETKAKPESETVDPVANVINTLMNMHTDKTADNLKSDGYNTETTTDIPDSNYEQTLSTKESLEPKNLLTETASTTNTSDIFQDSKILKSQVEPISMTSSSKEFQAITVINTNNEKETTGDSSKVSESVQIVSAEEIIQNQTEDKSKNELDDHRILSTKKSVNSTEEINEHETKNQPNINIFDPKTIAIATSTEVSTETVKITQLSTSEQIVSTLGILNPEKQVSESFPVSEKIPHLEKTLKIEAEILSMTVNSKKSSALSGKTAEKEKEIILPGNLIPDLENTSKEETIKKETESPTINELDESKTFEVNTPKKIDIQLKIQNEVTLKSEKLVSRTYLLDSNESEIIPEESLEIENDTISMTLNSIESSANSIEGNMKVEVNIPSARIITNDEQTLYIEKPLRNDTIPILENEKVDQETLVEGALKNVLEPETLNLTELQDVSDEDKLEVDAEAVSSFLKTDDAHSLLLEDNMQYKTISSTENQAVDLEITIQNITTNIHAEVAIVIQKLKDILTVPTEECIRPEKQHTDELSISGASDTALTEIALKTAFEPILTPLNSDASPISLLEITKKEVEINSLIPIVSEELQNISIKETIKKEIEHLKVNVIVESENNFEETAEQAGSENITNNQESHDEQNILTEETVKIEKLAIDRFRFSSTSDTALIEGPMKTETESISSALSYENSSAVLNTNEIEEVTPLVPMMSTDIQIILTEKTEQNKTEIQQENEQIDSKTISNTSTNICPNLVTDDSNLEDGKIIIEDSIQPATQVTDITPIPVASNETPIKEPLVTDIEPVSMISNTREPLEAPVKTPREVKEGTLIDSMVSEIIQAIPVSNTSQIEIHPKNVPEKVETFKMDDSNATNTEISTNILVSLDNITTSTEKVVETLKISDEKIDQNEKKSRLKIELLDPEVIVVNTLKEAYIEIEATDNQMSQFESTKSMKIIMEPENQSSESIPISCKSDIASEQNTFKTETELISSTSSSEKLPPPDEIKPDLEENILSTNVVFDEAQTSSVEETLQTATLPQLEYEQVIDPETMITNTVTNIHSKVKTDISKSDGHNTSTLSGEESVPPEKQVTDTILISNSTAPIEVPLKAETETAVTFTSTESLSELLILKNTKKLEEKAIQNETEDSVNKPVFSKKRIIYTRISISSDTDMEIDSQVSEDEQTELMIETIDSEKQVSDTNSISSACGEPSLEESLITEKRPFSVFKNIPVILLKEENNTEIQDFPSAQIVESSDHFIRNPGLEETENDINVVSINDMKSIGQEIITKILPNNTKSVGAHESTNVETEILTDILLMNVDETPLKVHEHHDTRVKSSTISMLPSNSRTVLSEEPFEIPVLSSTVISEEKQFKLDKKSESDESNSYNILSISKEKLSNIEIDTPYKAQISDDAIPEAQESDNNPILPIVEPNKNEIETVTPVSNKINSVIEKSEDIESINNQKSSCSEKIETEKLGSSSFFEYGETSKSIFTENENKSQEKSYGIQKLEMSVQRMKTSDDDYFEKTFVQLEQTEKISVGKNAVDDENNTAIDDKLYTVNESDLNAILCASSLQEAISLLDTKIKFKFKHSNRKSSSKVNSAIHKPNLHTPTSSSSNKNANFTEARKFFKEMEKKSKK